MAGHLRVKDEVLALGLPVENISPGGLFVRCDEPLPVGTPVALELTRPGLSPTLKLTGRTVGLVKAEAGSPAGMRIQFDPVPQDVAARLQRLLGDLAPAGAAAKPGGHNPAQIDEKVEGTRLQTFDFGFVSLGEAGEEEDWAEPVSAAAIERMAPQSPATAPASSAEPPGHEPLQVAHSAKLMVQVRGLLLEMGDLQTLLSQRERALSAAQGELGALRQALAQKEEELAELRRLLAAPRS
jgi:hypothetical protein